MKKFFSIFVLFLILTSTSCQVRVVAPYKPLQKNSIELYKNYTIQTSDAKIFKMEVRLIGKVAIVYPGGELKRLEKAINKKTKGKLKEMARRDNKTDEPLAFVRAHVFWAALFNLPECKVLIAKKVLENQAMAAVANLASSNVNAVRRVISLLKQELKWQRIKEVRLLIKR